MANEKLHDVIQELLGVELEAIALEEAYPMHPSNESLARCVLDHADPRGMAPELLRLLATAHLISLFDRNDANDLMQQT